MHRASCSLEYGFGVGVSSKQFGPSLVNAVVVEQLKVIFPFEFIGVCRPVTGPSGYHTETGDVVQCNRTGTVGSVVSS